MQFLLPLQLLVNNSDHAVLGSADNIKGSIIVSDTLHNISEGYRDKLAAQAGSTGTDGKFRRPGHCCSG